MDYSDGAVVAEKLVGKAAAATKAPTRDASQVVAALGAAATSRAAATGVTR